jgi:NADH:ubiquinone oxidoreductase subunit 6 (subunit J)
MLWPLVTAGNLLSAFTFLLIAWLICAPLQRTGQLSLRANPLGVALALVFVTSAMRFLWSAVNMLLPSINLNEVHGAALRESLSWGSVPLPFLTAAAGVLYLSVRLRNRTHDDAELFPDLAARRRRALEINDNIVQGLLAARELDAIGEREEARATSERALEHAQRMMGDLLEEDGDLRPGDLRRRASASRP